MFHDTARFPRLAAFLLVLNACDTAPPDVSETEDAEASASSTSTSGDPAASSGETTSAPDSTGSTTEAPEGTGTSGSESSSSGEPDVPRMPTLPSPEDFEFLGAVEFPAGEVMVDGTLLGGLSGLAYDGSEDRFLAICDDRSSIAPARFYAITVDLSDGALEDGDVAFVSSTTLLDEDDAPFEENELDPEGIARLADGSLYVSSEGEVDLGAGTAVAPWIRRFSDAGASLDELPVDEAFIPAFDDDGVQVRGVRNNLALESLSLSPDGSLLWTATENAVVQDGPAATVEEGTMVRLVRYDLDGGRQDAQFAYVAEPVAAAPVPEDAFRTSGLVELLALEDDGRLLLSLERSFSVGVGNAVRLYGVDVTEATDVSGRAALADDVVPAQKTLLVDFDTLGLAALDNVEGMAWGPALDDGRRSLILISDDNFNDGVQVTQVLAFAVEI